jgi:thiol-disulfide isomerase/thioredoxin
MISRRILILSGLTLLAAAPALAKDPVTWNEAAFDAAKAAGKPILLEIHAVWCPTCKAQAPILGELTSEPKYADLQVFKIDFDTEKDLLKKLNVRTQSTLIVYKQGAEVGRSVGDTSRDSIAELLSKTI